MRSPSPSYGLLVRAACLLALLAASAPTAEAQSRTRFLHWAYQDAFALSRAAAPRLPALALGGGATLMPVSLTDRETVEEVQEVYGASRVVSVALDAANELGGSKVNWPVYGFFLATLATKRTRLQDAAFTSIQAAVYAGAITGGLKMAIGRWRPYRGAGPGRLEPFSGHYSFPSGHTTKAFALVTPWVYYYPRTATYGLFVLSAGTAAARLAHDKHWLTDVLAGASIGFLTGRWLSRRHLGKAGGRRMRVAPAVRAGAPSLRVAYRLN